MQEKTDCGSVRIQGSMGTPVISAAEFTFTQGPWLSPKDSEASAWHEAAPLFQKPDSLTISLNKILAAWQQLPGFQERCWDAPRVAFMHKASQGRGSSTKHWPCTTSTSQGQAPTLTDGFWGTHTFADILSRQFLIKTLCDKGSGKIPFHKKDPGRAEIITKVC